MTPNSEPYDLIIIGGGINGAGIAADAAGRGFKTLLCEKGDLASTTSSASSKLIHGGLRYLEQYEFRLVRESLAEREVLIRKAPHIIKPMRFCLPHEPHLRPAWMLKVGLFLYDHLSKRITLPSSKGISFNSKSPLVESISKGFEYSDAWVEDARLVVLNAMDARNRGAAILPRTKCIEAKRQGKLWLVKLHDQINGEIIEVSCRALVNAAGPWVNQVFDQTIHESAPNSIRQIRGSHIIVPKIHDQSQAYILQNTDGRIVFVIPFEEDFSLVGTTDVEHKASLEKISISEGETQYLISVVNKYFKQKISMSDIVFSYSGVRPLLDDDADNPQAITRDYTLELDHSEDQPPLLSIYGGKITTYRKLAEAAVNKLSPFLKSAGQPWTANAPLPGGNFDSKASLSQQLKLDYPWLPDNLCNRFVTNYGTLSFEFLKGAKSLNDLGELVGADLYMKEMEYLVKSEWAMTTEDILWRRSKLGLKFSKSEVLRLEQLLSTLIQTMGTE